MVPWPCKLTLFQVLHYFLGRQLSAALCTTGSDYLAAVFRSHSLQKAMHTTALTLLGLESSFHDIILQKAPQWGIFYFLSLHRNGYDLAS